MIKNIKGHRFGRLVAMELVTDEQLTAQVRGTNRGAVWRCKCDCGQEKLAVASRLRWVNSCGCYAKEYQSQMGKKYGGCNKKIGAGKRGLFQSYRSRAKIAKIAFELEETVFYELTSSPCFYCGRQPISIFKPSHSTEVYPYNGLDRVNNLEGYVTGNCVSCCFICNYSKRNLTQQEFASWIGRVESHWGRASRT